jgi:hypothetical protein
MNREHPEYICQNYYLNQKLYVSIMELVIWSLDTLKQSNYC